MFVNRYCKFILMLYYLNKIQRLNLTEHSKKYTVQKEQKDNCLSCRRAYNKTKTNVHLCPLIKILSFMLFRQ